MACNSIRQRTSNEASALAIWGGVFYRTPDYERHVTAFLQDYQPIEQLRCSIVSSRDAAEHVAAISPPPGTIAEY